MPRRRGASDSSASDEDGEEDHPNSTIPFPSPSSPMALSEDSCPPVCPPSGKNCIALGLQRAPEWDGMFECATPMTRKSSEYHTNRPNSGWSESEIGPRAATACELFTILHGSTTPSSIAHHLLDQVDLRREREEGCSTVYYSAREPCLVMGEEEEGLEAEEEDVVEGNASSDDRRRIVATEVVIAVDSLASADALPFGDINSFPFGLSAKNWIDKAPRTPSAEASSPSAVAVANPFLSSYDSSQIKSSRLSPHGKAAPGGVSTPCASSVPADESWDETQHFHRVDSGGFKTGEPHHPLWWSAYLDPSSTTS